MMQLFKKADANGDGVLDKAEFVVFFKLMQENCEMARDCPMTVDEVFVFMDEDMDGKISPKEFQTFFM